MEKGRRDRAGALSDQAGNGALRQTLTDSLSVRPKPPSSGVWDHPPRSPIKAAAPFEFLKMLCVDRMPPIDFDSSTVAATGIDGDWRVEAVWDQSVQTNARFG